MSRSIREREQAALETVLDRTEQEWAELISAMDDRRPYDDGSGCLQDPGTAIAQAVLEVVPLRAVRLVLSVGGPAVRAEAIVERDGHDIVAARLIGFTMSDRIERPIEEGSALWRLLRSHAIELGD